ncbi:MAG: hypothetical protein U1F25_08885 [Rubrivivax sp.]
MPHGLVPLLALGMGLLLLGARRAAHTADAPEVSHARRSCTRAASSWRPWRSLPPSSARWPWCCCAWLHARQLPPGGALLLPLTTAHIAGPPLEAAPQPALKAMQAEQAKRLHGLGWVDEPHGIAHILIEDAMALLAGRAASALGSQRSQRPRGSPAMKKPAACLFALALLGVVHAQPTDAGLQPMLGAELPLEAVFTDSEGRTGRCANTWARSRRCSCPATTAARTCAAW